MADVATTAVVEDIPGYRIERAIDRGPGYIVYRARRESDRAAVLIKLVGVPAPGARAAVDRLESEFELTRELTGDGIPKALELVSCPAGRALVLEDHGGAPLHAVVDPQRSDPEQALEVVLNLALAVDRLHRQGIVHGALQPSHVYLHPDTGMLWLTGLDLAARLNDDRPRVAPPELPRERLAYVAPEQTGRMNRPVGLQADLYAIGVLLYELLTGRLPFAESDPLQMIHAHLARVPERPGRLRPGIPPAVEAIVMKLLAKAAEDRYQSAAGLGADLIACLSREIQADFTPGRHDLPDQIRIPDKLYGRERELEVLMRAFERAAGGSTEFVIVAGYSGVGKSALVQEVHNPIVRGHGYFTSGKFDQFKRNIPHSAIISAFRELTRQILTESAEAVARWRAELLAAVEQNGQVIVNVIPEIELIIGPQPPLPDLLPAETKNRFNLVFQRFIRVFARAEHPLVLFLDDLQWADGATLELLRAIAEDGTLSHALIIGAYRDNEVGSEHPLAHAIRDLQSTAATLTPITLEPLRIGVLNRFVADTLNGPFADAAPLAELIHEKTDGNPFFLIQFLKLMHAEGCLALDHAGGYWRYDLSAIHRLGITDNVVDLMLRKIQQLPARTQNAIKLAACIGDTFDIGTLAVVSEVPAAQATIHLRAAVRHGLVRALTQSGAGTSAIGRPPDWNDCESLVYRFLHDRVQQAAYALIPEAQRPRVHLSIGRLLLEHADAASLDENIFEITGHLNRGASLLTDARELKRLAALNLAAGRKAKSATAYQPALDYFAAGCGHLGPQAWDGDYELAFALSLERAETEYLCGNFERADRQLSELLKRADSPLDKAEIYRIRIVEYENTARFPEARDWGKAGLALFDIAFPEDRAERLAYLQGEIDAITTLIGDRAIESLIGLPVMTNKAMRISMKLLMTMWAPSYIAGDMLLTQLIAAKMVHLSLRYGNVGESCYGYVTYGAWTGVRTGDYESAYAFGKLALAVNEALDDLSSRAKVNHMFSCYIGFWRRPIEACFAYSQEAHRSGLASGDLIYAAYGVFHESWHALFRGKQLSEFQQEYSSYLDFMVRTKNQTFYDAHRLMLQWGLALMGQTRGPCSLDGDGFDERKYLETYRGLDFFIRFFWVIKTQLYYFQGRFEEALEASDRARALADKTEGMIWDAWGCFYRALTLVAGAPPAGEATRARLESELDQALHRLRVWAANCPQNFGHRYAVLRAEVAAFRGAHGEAIDAYESAIEQAAVHGFVQIEALANERCGVYWLGRGRRELAGFYLRAAAQCYARWGSAGKVRELGGRYPELIPGTPAGGDRTDGSRSLDWSAVVRAAQVISGEVEERGLLEKLLQIVLENAGAERGFIVLNQDGVLTLAGGAAVKGAVPEAALGRPLGPETEIAVSVIRYVDRVGEDVVLADAGRDHRFCNDPYIQQRQPLSLLCTPILHKGQPIGLLYLENNLVRDAFTPERTEIVRMLAAQAAISIENARLYQDMKQEIAERKLIESRLRQVAEATSPVTGSDYFGSLVRCLADAFDVRYALIARCNDERKLRVRTIAFWQGDGFGENFEYALAGTPCEQVVCGNVVQYTHDVQSSFPNDADLAAFDAQSYLGIPLFDGGGRVIGHLAVFDDKPMPNRRSDVAILNIFATRTGAELERIRAAEELQRAHDQLELRVRDRTEALSRANRQLQQEIAERAAVEVKLKEAKDLAEASNLAKSRFLANMSHELRTPLNAILGYAQILKRDRTLSPAQAHGIDTIMASGEHLLALIDDVLSLSKIEAGKLGLAPAEFRLATLLNCVVGIVRVRAEEKGIEFRYRQQGKLPLALHGDERALRQVLLNLIGNAIKFTDSGRVTFTVGCRIPREGTPMLRFEVADTGIGIPRDRQQEIFEPFRQLEHPGRLEEGTGLGLAISRNLVALMGSHIEVESTPGEGSTFRFEIALPGVAITRSVKDDRRVIGYHGPRKRVLIADDRAENRAIVSELLAPLGFEVAEAVDGRDAFAKTRQWHPDVVLMDLVMPVMDGLTATRAIKAEAEPGPPVIIALSASAMESNRRDSAAAGCDDFLPKPVRARALLQKLRSHLGLEWLVEDERGGDGNSADPALALKPPAPETLATLLELARLGDVRGVLETAGRIAADDPELGPFAAEIETRAGRYQLRQLIELLDRLAGQAGATPSDPPVVSSSTQPAS